MADAAPLSDTFFRRGWIAFPHDPAMIGWVRAARPAAAAAVRDPGNAGWMRYRRTWFAGVNVLPNGPDGAVGGARPLVGPAVDFVRDGLGIDRVTWDRGQVSVVYPGYPLPGEAESDAAFRFRRDRDAAHVDGLLPVGPERRRMLREPHAFVLGIPLTENGPGAAPLVVWEGSHEVIRRRLGAVLDVQPPENWADVDVTEAYHAARREIFETCRRVPVHRRPGEAYLIHRLALHGVAPWQEGAEAPPEGRMIVYFRPAMEGPGRAWLVAA